MNKTVIAVVGIISVTCLIAFYVWASHRRYYIMPGSGGGAYEVDRKTGETWMLYGGRKFLQQGTGESNQKETELPYWEAIEVTGNSGLGSGSFSGTLYNGSSWTVTRVILNVSAKEANGFVRWTRDFSAAETISPLTTEPFSIRVTGEQGIKDAPRAFTKVLGYKEH